VGSSKKKSNPIKELQMTNLTPKTIADMAEVMETMDHETLYKTWENLTGHSEEALLRPMEDGVDLRTSSVAGSVWLRAEILKLLVSQG
jgi:hypothetical protein